MVGPLVHPSDVIWTEDSRLSPSDPSSEGPLLGAALASFVAMAVLAAVDLWADLGEGAARSHVLTEGAILLLGFLGAGLVARRLVVALKGTEARASSLEGQLEATAAEAQRWREEARTLMAGLGRAIDTQFERWQLTAAEKEVGLLLLKGLTHKEIAAVRTVTEATARQQARAVYRKAGVSGRHDLAAFFLEDLMLPAAGQPGQPSSGAGRGDAG